MIGDLVKTDFNRMNKANFYLSLLVLFLTVNQTNGQKMFWTDMTEEDKRQALDISLKFRAFFNNSEIDQVGEWLYGGQIYIGDEVFIDRRVFLNYIKKVAGKNLIPETDPVGYRFDEFLENHINNPFLKAVFPVFDNHSILVSLGSTNTADPGILMVVRKLKDDTWAITGLTGIFNIEEFKKVPEISDYRVETIEQAGLKLPVAEIFSQSEVINNQKIFFYEGKSGRDAVLQIMSDQLKAKVYYYTFKFVEHNNQQFQMSNLIVRYLPIGILYEYEVVDPEGNSNKGITVGIKSGERVILIQFYSFLDVFRKIRDDIYYSLYNVDII